MKQFIITPAAGKRLIAKAMVKHPAVVGARTKGTIVIIAGTTNGYIAEEMLAKIDKKSSFPRHRFFRGIVLPPGGPKTKGGRLANQSGFPGASGLVVPRYVAIPFLYLTNKPFVRLLVLLTDMRL